MPESKEQRKKRIVSEETRAKISKANDGNFFAICDYCGIRYHTRSSAYKKRTHHFCSRSCYHKYQSECIPKEEHSCYGTGYSAEEHQRRVKARTIFNHYLRDKHMSRQLCEICGKPAQAHHDDYDKPLEVRWLCPKHHMEWHKNHGGIRPGKKGDLK